MRSLFILWSTALIVSMVASGLGLRYLAVQGVSSADSLISRGLVCLALVIVFARRKRHSLWPNAIRTQVLRAAVAGLALTFFTLSYEWLTASAVSVLSNVDVPLLIVLGPIVGVQATRRARLLATLSILFLIWYVSGLEGQVHLSYGLASLMTGTLLLCFGYLFIKKSMSEENEAVTILVPSLAIIVYGLLQRHGAGTVWTSGVTFAAVMSGAGMFGAYFATMRLYERTDLASAEFPTLLASLVIQPLETAFMNAPLSATYLVSSAGFVVAIFVLLQWRKREMAHA